LCPDLKVWTRSAHATVSGSDSDVLLGPTWRRRSRAGNQVLDLSHENMSRFFLKREDIYKTFSPASSLSMFRILANLETRSEFYMSLSRREKHRNAKKMGSAHTCLKFTLPTTRRVSREEGIGGELTRERRSEASPKETGVPRDGHVVQLRPRVANCNHHRKWYDNKLLLIIII